MGSSDGKLITSHVFVRDTLQQNIDIKTKGWILDSLENITTFQKIKENDLITKKTNIKEKCLNEKKGIY